LTRTTATLFSALFMILALISTVLISLGIFSIEGEFLSEGLAGFVNYLVNSFSLISYYFPIIFTWAAILVQMKKLTLGHIASLAASVMVFSTLVLSLDAAVDYAFIPASVYFLTSAAMIFAIFRLAPLLKQPVSGITQSETVNDRNKNESPWLRRDVGEDEELPFSEFFRKSPKRSKKEDEPESGIEKSGIENPVIEETTGRSKYIPILPGKLPRNMDYVPSGEITARGRRGSGAPAVILEPDIRELEPVQEMPSSEISTMQEKGWMRDVEDAEVIDMSEDSLQEIVQGDYNLHHDGSELESSRSGFQSPSEGQNELEPAKNPADKKQAAPKTKKSTYVRYSLPLEELLHRYENGEYWVIDEATKDAAEVLKNTLEEFKISAEVTGIRKGPVITMFEILPAPGVKLSKITNLADNIALRLAASSVRIVAPIPGKHAVGIEVPNKNRAIVSFLEMLQTDKFKSKKMEIPVILGKDIAGENQIVDLVQTPHLLIAGATGSGKSVCVNSLICSILSSRSPKDVRLMLIDPKIVELKLYNDIPHLLTPVITEPKMALSAIKYCLAEMERRYSLLDTQAVRDIRSFNAKVKNHKLAMETLPYIVLVVDEFADLMATSGKELEGVLARLAAMSRAVGIHLVLATQRPSIDVITGLIKANIPSRIAFMVAGKFDSRIIIDSVGAEKLLGKGDMLFTSAWDPNPKRIQGAFLSEEEVNNIGDHLRSIMEPDYLDEDLLFDEDDDQLGLFSSDENDPMYDKALEIVVHAGKASASYLQRRLKIGYNRAARLVEEMEMRGIVGPAQGSKPREVLHIPDTK
jgi:S-DNA-T family DNA segregation ATPase FtsK/SpoIIIE